MTKHTAEPLKRKQWLRGYRQRGAASAGVPDDFRDKAFTEKVREFMSTPEYHVEMAKRGLDK